MEEKLRGKSQDMFNGVCRESDATKQLIERHKKIKCKTGIWKRKALAFRKWAKKTSLRLF